MVSMERLLICVFLQIINANIINCSTDNETIKYYEDIIDDGIRSFNTYVAPTDAKQYEGNYFDYQAAYQDFGKYDFVVIGGGSSGSVLAARLSEVPSWNVLLLEAGEPENDFTDIPMFSALLRNSKFNWGYISEPQKGACLGMIDNKCPIPRGRALGGSSVINGMIYSRGSPKNFDLWNSLITRGSWSYKDVFPYFLKSEGSEIPNLDMAYHSTTGSMPINLHVPNSPLTDEFLNAYKDIGVNQTDVNAASQFGVTLTPLIMSNGRRVSSAKAYLTGQTRSNLHVVTGAFVTKLLINPGLLGIVGKRVHAVEFTVNGKKSIVKVSKEAILSAGSIGSPVILMHSGVGPADVLYKNRIRIIQGAPNVGKNLNDHPAFYGLIFNSSYREDPKPRREYIEEYLQGIGPYTIAANLQSISYHGTQLRQYRDIPDIELLFVPANSTGPASQRVFRLRDETYDALWKHTDPTQTFLILVTLLRPRSSGYVSLRSNNPFDYPIIDPKFLLDADDYDIESLYLGVQHALELIETPSFQNINANLVNYTFPACQHTSYLSKEYWYCTIRQMSMHLYHPMGTCAMMDRQRGGVVDGDLRVYGIENLRVIDASVIPFPISGHTHAAAVMIAEKGADTIKKRYSIPI